MNHSRQTHGDPAYGAGSAPGRNRTCDLALRRRALYPLSYRRGALSLALRVMPLLTQHVSEC